MLDVCLLGTGGMMPLPYRWLTSLMVRYNGSSLLIDCGEGTQIAIKEKGWSFKPIDVICFTHYHGDHLDLFHFVPESIPQYIGKTAKQVVIEKYKRLSYIESEKERFTSCLQRPFWACKKQHLFFQVLFFCCCGLTKFLL